MTDAGDARPAGGGVLLAATALVLALALSGCAGGGVRLSTVSRSGRVTSLRSAEPTTPALQRAPTPNAALSSTDLATDDRPAPDEAPDSRGWWLFVVALVAAGLAAYLPARSRSRTQWSAALAADEAEATWFAHELLPGLELAATPDALAGGWQVGSARVVASEDRLTGLEATAPDDAARARARALRDALHGARIGVEELVAARLPGPRTAELSLLAGQVEGVLERARPVLPPASGTA